MRLSGRCSRSLLIMIVCAHASGLTQTTVNPDISVIPRFLVQTDDGQKLAQGKREFSQPDLSFQEL